MLTLITLVIINKIFTNNNLIIHSNNIISIMFLWRAERHMYIMTLSGDTRRIVMHFSVE